MVPLCILAWLVMIDMVILQAPFGLIATAILSHRISILTAHLVLRVLAK
jgi:hypothetical protein